MIMSYACQVSSIVGTRRLAHDLAICLPDRLTIGLEGTLGAGKTLFVQALAAALGVPSEMVVSPTFVLCNHYQGTKPIYHLDAYRIQDQEEFLALGVQEYFAADGITLIEWADRVGGILPTDYLRIEVLLTSSSGREFVFTASGIESQRVVDCLRQHRSDGGKVG